MDKQEENQENFMCPKYNLDSFQHGSTVYLYKKRLDKKLTANEESDFTEIYENIIQNVHGTAKEVLGEKHRRQSRKTW
jgi:hypothetical protein